MIGLGGFLLWFGWFGFNAGSTLELNESIAKIALNTHLAACAGALGATLTYVLTRQPILMTGIVNGSLAGLVSITAGCATMSGGWALLTGLVGGVICIAAGKLLLRWKIDDVVGAIPVHGFAGAWGTLAAGMFIQGDLFNLQQTIVQLIGIGSAFVWAVGTSYGFFVMIDKLMGLRSKSLHEQRGLDFTEHAEAAFPEFQVNVTHQQNQ
jgi:Amt family ammonium transporter